MIVLDRVGMTYRADSGPVEALRDISFTVGRGELVALVGPSGCGKSTLLRIIAGLRSPTTGCVAVDGRPVEGPIAAVGMVFQAPVLLKWRTVRDNVLLPAQLSGLDPRRFRERAEALLALVGLGEFAGRYPRELSGGMQQRVEIARVLINHPRVLLMDEPFGALDALTRVRMQELLLDLWARLSPTVVFVTHDIDEALFLADRVLVLSVRPGRIVEALNVPFERPRRAAHLTDPAFVALKRRCLALLRHDARAPALERLTPLGSPSLPPQWRFAT